MKNKLFVFLLLGLFLISIASAWEFDNVKSYDAVKKEITITNAFGLGGDIAKIRLNTPQNLRVGLGYQKVAEFNLNNLVSYSDILEKIDFYDLKNENEKKEIIFDIKYKTYENVEVSDYKRVCEKKQIKENITESCENIKIGSHLEKKETWKTLNTKKEFLKDEFLTIGIFTEVKYEDKIEWIPTIYGVEVNEWATWTADLNTDLVAYYKLDEISGAVIDSVGNYNGTARGSPTTNVVGKIGTAYTFSDVGNSYVNITNSVDFKQANTFSYGGWFKTTGITASSIFCSMALRSVSQSAGTYLLINNNDVNDGQLAFQTGTQNGGTAEGVLKSGGDYNDGNWHYVIVTFNGTNKRIYVDGLNVANATSSSVAYDTVNHVGIGDWVVNDAHHYQFDGELDEISYWKRTLSSAEVIKLYNGGVGMSYTNEFDDSPITTLISPTTNTNYTTSQNLDVVCYGSDDTEFDEMQLIINEGVNQTNASGMNNTNYTFNVGLGDGDYTIYCKGYDNNSASTSSSSVRIVIDSIHPQLYVSNLTDLVTFSLPINSTWNFNVSDVNIDDCWYNATGISNTIVTCNSTINTTWATGGIKSLTYCANDTFNNQNCTTTTLNVYDFTVTQSANNISGDGSQETFTLYVDSNSFAIGDANANLWYNGTNKGVSTKTVINTTRIKFTNTFVIANGTGNSTGNPISWFWNYNTTQLTTRNTSTQTQTVYSVSISDCDVTTGYVILNLSLKDEELNSLVNITLPVLS